MIQVRIKENESITNALSRFKKQCVKAGIQRELKKRSRYEKPSERRRKARKNNKKRYQ